MPTGLHTEEQEFHFSNLRHIIWCTQHVFLFVDFYELQVTKHTLVPYKKSAMHLNQLEKTFVTARDLTQTKRQLLEMLLIILGTEITTVDAR